MNPARVVRPADHVGEDYFWTDDNGLQGLTFRRGVFHVSIEAGSAATTGVLLGGGLGCFAVIVQAILQWRKRGGVVSDPVTSQPDANPGRGVL